MSYLDYGLCILSIVLMIELFFRKKPFNKILVCLILDVAMIFIHFTLDDVRWQVVILYALPMIMIGYSLLLHIDYQGLQKWTTRLYKIITSILVVLSILTIAMMPIPVLEAPTGPYVVGTTLMNVQDSERVEIFGPKTGNRDLRIQIWYPADQKDQTPVNWFIDGEKSLSSLAESNGVFGFMLNHLIDVKSHSYLNLPVSTLESNYPVVVMSHGWSSSRILHVNFAEALASHGYVVVGIDHTYAAAITRLENGDIGVHDASILPKEDFVDEGAILIDVFKKDIRFVMSELEGLNQTHRILKDKMDLERMGLLGHSTGAGADVQYALEYDVDAVVGFDPWVEPVEITGMLNEPALFIRSGEWHDSTNNEHLKMIADEVYEVKDARHQDFSMALDLSPLQKWIGWSGGDSSEIQIKLLLNFFDHHLKALELDPSVYEDTQLQRYDLNDL